MKYLIRLTLLLLIVPLSTCNKSEEYWPGQHPKNIILIIGDGMGLAHVYAALATNHGHLNLDACTNLGFSKTYSASDFITDSGAGGTAIATGTKTYNGAIGVNTDSLPQKSILEYAEANGLSTGLIATSAITHATPASFIAHVKNRDSYDAIALDFLKTDIDLFIGGGLKNFNNRSDSLNLIDSLNHKGYQVLYTLNDVLKSNQRKIAALLASEAMPRYSKGRGNMLPLAGEKAFEVLSHNRNGFFIMCEASQIDWGAHENDSAYVVEEVLDMDKLVGMALAFAKKDQNTLVIVTADHETGGLSITGGNIRKGEVSMNFATKHHTGVMVPVYAFGPGADNFRGIYENTEIFWKMMQALQLSTNAH
jgi:alkaline phosphatase